MTTATSHLALSVGVANHRGKSFTFTVKEQVATKVDGIIAVEFEIRCLLNVKIVESRSCGFRVCTDTSVKYFF